MLVFVGLVGLIMVVLRPITTNEFRWTANLGNSVLGFAAWMELGLTSPACPFLLMVAACVFYGFYALLNGTLLFFAPREMLGKYLDDPLDPPQLAQRNP